MIASARNHVTAFAAAVVIAVSVSACGGGGGGGGGGNGVVHGPTVPVDVAGISVIHLEMTDSIAIPTGPNPVYTQTDQDPVEIQTSRRTMTVCPGVPPRGNECSFSRQLVDGVEYNTPGVIDRSIDWHRDRLSLLNLSYWLDYGAVAIHLGVSSSGDTEAIAGSNEYSFFYTNTHFGQGFVEPYAAAFGALYEGGRPSATLGSAFWTGAMIGRDIFDSTRLIGLSTLEYDFSDDTVDLILSGIRTTSGGSYHGGSSIQWLDLPVNSDGSFYISGHGNDRLSSGPHPTLGYVDGDFYGPNGEEFAGVFERDRVIGAFGGDRQN